MATSPPKTDNNLEIKDEGRPERVPLRESIGFTIKVAVTDASVFNHYILKEYAPRCQGVLGISKSPAKHTLENCLYDEICGWLDSPTVTGISILSVKIEDPVFKNEILVDEPRINFREIVDLMYDICKLEASASKDERKATVDRVRFKQLKERCKWLLDNVDKVDFDDSDPKKTSESMGASLREGGGASGLS